MSARASTVLTHQQLAAELLRVGRNRSTAFFQRMFLSRSKDLEEIFQNHYGFKIISNGFQRKNRPEYPKMSSFEASPTDFNVFFPQMNGLKLRYSIRPFDATAKGLGETGLLYVKNALPWAICDLIR